MAISLTDANGNSVSSFGSGSSQWATGARANEAAFGQRNLFASPGQTPITDTTDQIGNGQMYPNPEGAGGTHNGMRHAGGAAASSGGTPHLLARGRPRHGQGGGRAVANGGIRDRPGGSEAAVA